MQSLPSSSASGACCCKVNNKNYCCDLKTGLPSHLPFRHGQSYPPPPCLDRHRLRCLRMARMANGTGILSGRITTGVCLSILRGSATMKMVMDPRRKMADPHMREASHVGGGVLPVISTRRPPHWESPGGENSTMPSTSRLPASAGGRGADGIMIRSGRGQAAMKRSGRDRCGSQEFTAVTAVNS